MVKEIIEYYYNQKSQTLKVSFRFNEDNDEYIREDEFEIDYIDNSGYSILENYDYESSDFPISYEEDTDDLIIEEDEEYNIDETELVLFLNEYYESNPKKIPPSELF